MVTTGLSLILPLALAVGSAASRHEDSFGAAEATHTWIAQEMALAYGWGNSTLIYVKTESGSGPAACVCVGNFHRLSAVGKQ